MKKGENLKKTAHYLRHEQAKSYSAGEPRTNRAHVKGKLQNQKETSGGIRNKEKQEEANRKTVNKFP